VPADDTLVPLDSRTVSGTGPLRGLSMGCCCTRDQKRSDQTGTDKQ